MELLFPVIFLAALLLSLQNHTADALSSACIAGASEAMTLFLTLGGSMAFWSGMMQIAESCGIVRWLSRLFSPVLRLIFGQLSSESKELISLNAAANLLGLGNAATPSGLKAMKRLEEEKHQSRQTLLVILNSCSLQLIPTSVAAVRLAAGSKTPFDITVPILIASAVSITSALLLAKLFYIIGRGNKK